MKERNCLGCNGYHEPMKNNPFDISDLKKTLIEVRNGGMITPALNKIQSKINEGLKGLMEEIGKTREDTGASMALEIDHPARIRKEEWNNCVDKIQQIISKYIKNG